MLLPKVGKMIVRESCTSLVGRSGHNVEMKRVIAISFTGNDYSQSKRPENRRTTFSYMSTNVSLRVKFV